MLAYLKKKKKQDWQPCSIHLYEISIVYISTLLKNIDININKDNIENIDIDKTILKDIDSAIDIDKDNLGNIDINIDKAYLENIDIDIDKNILKNIYINIDIYNEIFGEKIYLFQQL